MNLEPAGFPIGGYIRCQIKQTHNMHPERVNYTLSSTEKKRDSTSPDVDGRCIGEIDCNWLIVDFYAVPNTGHSGVPYTKTQALQNRYYSICLVELSSILL